MLIGDEKSTSLVLEEIHSMVLIIKNVMANDDVLSKSDDSICIVYYSNTSDTCQSPMPISSLQTGFQRPSS